MVDLICKAQKLIKQNLLGLNSFSRLVVYEALEYCDYKKGIIYLPTLYEFAINSFYVERAPGRKREEINENTIRNALRTIKKFKGDFFKIRSVNQRIEIEMPEVRKLYESFVASNNDAGVESGYKNTPESLVNIEDKGVEAGVELSEKTPEVAAAYSPYKENIYNKHNSNKQTAGDNKLPIADDFYPSKETIEKAQERGFLKVTDAKEIARFIEYNKANETRWEDFNEVYLGWLNRCFTHKPKKTVQNTGNKRKFNDEQRHTTHKEYDTGSKVLNGVVSSWAEKIQRARSGRVHHGHAS